MSDLPDPHRLALVVCGALVREVEAISRERGWRARVFGVPARHHLHPEGIAEAVDELLEDLSDRFEQVVVVYGDCGTAGALDRVLARHGAVRPAGPHCYAMLAGRELASSLAESPDTYVLTDYLVRNWESTILEGVSRTARATFLDRLFDGFTRLAYLRQRPDPALDRKAASIAAELGLPLEVHDPGLHHLETTLAEMIQVSPERLPS